MKARNMLVLLLSAMLCVLSACGGNKPEIRTQGQIIVSGGVGGGV